MLEDENDDDPLIRAPLTPAPPDPSLEMEDEDDMEDYDEEDDEIWMNIMALIGQGFHVTKTRTHLRLKQITQKKRQIQHKNFQSVTSHMPPIMLLHVHIKLCAAFSVDASIVLDVG